MKKNILFICGSLNQTTMMHSISRHLEQHNCYFTPYYADGFIRMLSRSALLDFSILGGQFRKKTMDYLAANNLKLDFEGKDRNYDLVFTCTDLIIQKNIHNKKVILVQEGMTDPENLLYYLVKYLGFPRWLASTSTTGLSFGYSLFCVASEGYKKLFIRKGAQPSRIIVTGIPNFDNCRQYLNNNFPHKGYVLVATSDARETFKYENRKKFIRQAVEIAAGRQLIFKLHPNENMERASAEIRKYAPGALIYTSGNTPEMIANCDTLITKYSSVVYIGLALGREVYSLFDIEALKKLLPVQNNGDSAENIAMAAEKLLESQEEDFVIERTPLKIRIKKLIHKLKQKSFAGADNN